MHTQGESPAWLCSLLSEKFFTPCFLHEFSKKNEKNIFCLDCVTTICPHCALSHHRSHRLLQVRRYVYHDVIRLEDLEKLIDCAFVQAYTTNSAKVVFINQRPKSRPFKGSGSLCNTCRRSLQELYHFCSLACKVQYLVRYKGCIGRYLYDSECLPLSDLGCVEQVEDGQMTPNSTLDGEMMLVRTSSSSGSSGNTSNCPLESVGRNTWSGANVFNYQNAPPPAPPSWSSSSFPPAPFGRRKGVPQRSPLF